MSEITTYTGKLFDSTNPNISDIDLKDIAHVIYYKVIYKTYHNIDSYI